MASSSAPISAMSDERLFAIEETARNHSGAVSPLIYRSDVLALVAEVRRLRADNRGLPIRPPVRIDLLHSVTCDYEECEADATWLVGDFYRCDDHRGTGAYGEDAG